MRELVEQKKADGLILFGQGDDIQHFEEVVTPDLPAVVWGQVAPESGYITVGTNNFQGGRLATEHLLQLGRKNICFAGHLSFETEQRFAGYRKALKDADLSYVHQLDVRFTFADARRVTKALLDGGQFHYDAVVAASDTIALGMMKALNEAGIKVPEQVAIVGYDDISVSAFTTPALTTIRQDTTSGGKQLVDLLFQRMAGKKVESAVMDTRLIIRSSTD